MEIIKQYAFDIVDSRDSKSIEKYNNYSEAVEDKINSLLGYCPDGCESRVKQINTNIVEVFIITSILIEFYEIKGEK